MSRRLSCAFCRRSREEVYFLFVSDKPLCGFRLAICDGCVADIAQQMAVAMTPADVEKAN